MATLPRLQQFDVAQGIAIRDNARNRYLDDQKQSALQRIGQLAASGDMNAASGEAFRSGQLDIGARIKQMSQEEQARLVDDAASWAYSAQTPEAWEAGRQMWAEKGFDVGDFGTRDQLISRAMSVKEQMQMQMQRDNAARAQANSDRSYGLQREALDFRKSQAGSGMGKAPTGYRWAQDGSLEPIPGGPAAAKQAEADASQNARTTASLAQADRLINKVDEAMKNVSRWTSGAGSALSMVPGTPARNLDADLTTIKANLGFAELQAMREASPTGGALGQVAVQELQALQATVASLDQAQSPDQLRQSLAQVKEHYENWKATVQQASGSQGDMQTGLPQPGMVEDGYRFLGGDPANPNSWEPAQ